MTEESQLWPDQNAWTCDTSLGLVSPDTHPERVPGTSKPCLRNPSESVARRKRVGLGESRKDDFYSQLCNQQKEINSGSTAFQIETGNVLESGREHAELLRRLCPLWGRERAPSATEQWVPSVPARAPASCHAEWSTGARSESCSLTPLGCRRKDLDTFVFI